MTRVLSVVAATLLAIAAVPTQAPADVMNFKLLTRYSQASFRSDAPLETFVGTSALEIPPSPRRERQR